MNKQAEVHDNPTDWVADHIKRYLETDGEDGHSWRGTQTLLLTTTGRKSGQKRRTALIYAKVGDNYVVVASRGGAPAHPGWYLNLSETPDVDVQVMGDRFAATARTASPDEKESLWPIMTAEWPQYDQYQAKTDREIPVVILEKTTE